LPFLDAGGVYVNVNVRGSGEYGREWHQAGKKASKPKTWRCLIDVCEMLVRDRLTTPRQLSVITQFDGPMITFDDGQRSHRGV
jgi:prolyl oligopeptidase